MFVKSKLSVFVLWAILMISTFTGCNIQSNTNSQSDSYFTTAQTTTIADTTQTDNNTTKKIDIQAESTTPNTELFEVTFDEYSEALISITPVLISEFNSEADITGEGINYEAMLEEKQSDLEDIFYEGIAKFVIIAGDTGASEDEYEFWYNELEKVYHTQTNELINSCAQNNYIEYGEDIDY